MSSQDLSNAIKSINDSAGRANTTTDFFNRVLDGGQAESSQNPLTGAVVPSVQKAVYDQYKNDINQINLDVADSNAAADRAESAANAVWNRRTVYAAVNSYFAEYQDDGRTLTPRLSFDGSQYLPMFDSSVPVTFTGLPRKNGDGTITVATDKGDRQFSRFIAEAVSLAVMARNTITFKKDREHSAVYNMIAGRIDGVTGMVTHKVGNIYSTGGSTWEVKTVSNPMKMEDFIVRGSVNPTDFGADPTGTVDSTQAFHDALDAVPHGGSLDIDVGRFKVTNIVHPLKPVNWHGKGRHNDFKDNISGTVIEGTLDTLTPVLYFPPPSAVTDRVNHCRFSSLNSMSVYGNGASDDTGNVICIKINNQGVNLNDVSTRYGAVGVECNTATGQQWVNCTFTASTYAVWFRYDSATPYEDNVGGEISWATANSYHTVQVHTSTTKHSAVGWLVEATCNYGQNTHVNVDFEACYVGCRFEGRRADRDYQRTDGSTITAYGASAWQGSGNVLIGCWWERNTSNNIEFSNDPNEAEAALGFVNMFQDVHKVLKSNLESSNLVYHPQGVRKVTHDKYERDAGIAIGEWGSPLTAGQHLVNGPTVNTPLVRSIIREGIPLSSANRSANAKSTYEFSAISAALPEAGGALKIAEINLFESHKNVLMEVQAVATSDAGDAYALDATYLVSNKGDAITQSVVREHATTKMLNCVGIRTGTNTFGVYIWKEATSAVIRATFDVKIVVSGGYQGGFDSTCNKTLIA